LQSAVFATAYTIPAIWENRRQWQKSENDTIGKADFARWSQEYKNVNDKKLSRHLSKYFSI